MPDSHGVPAPKFPSPRASSRDNAGGSNAAKKAKENGTYISGSINPEWLESLMLWPVGWTSLEPLEDLGGWPQNVWADGESEPDVPRVKGGVAGRTMRIRAVGNGQVPRCAAAAFLRLLEIDGLKEGGGER